MKQLQKKPKDIFAFCTNITLILLGVLGIIFLFTVPFVRFDGKSTVANWTTFKYFTTDSNIILTIVCIISMIYTLLLWKGKIKQIPQWVGIVKLIGTVGVALTMFVTVFFLLPGTLAVKGQFPPASLFMGSNLLFHLINPIVAILCYLLFENRKDIPLVKTLYALIPVLIYGIFYLCMAYTHVKPDGTIDITYDWYRFCSFGIIATPFVFIIVTGVYYLFTWLLWLGNRKINLKSLA